MKQWYFELAAFSPEVGFEFQFSASNEGNTYLHLCRITEVITGKKLAYSWQYDGYPGSSVVIFELFDEGSKTRVKLTHTGLGSFPAGKDFARESFMAGWTFILGTSLKAYLEK